VWPTSRQPRVTLVYGFGRIGASGWIADRAITFASCTNPGATFTMPNTLRMHATWSSDPVSIRSVESMCSAQTRAAS
jgi:hypothetical protein